jgi:hypothetical protein
VTWKPLAGAAIVAGGVLGHQLLRPETVETRHVPITTKIVFNREIAQIFQRKCFQCHTDGNISVPLTTYKEARPWAVAIKEEVLERKMPPWGPVAGIGHFSNDMNLTTREISLILAWADGGAPSGVLLADEDKQPVYVPSLDRWEQGEPDEVFSIAKDVKVASDAPFRIERFEVATGLKEVRWLRALQLKPADRKPIRYAAVYESAGGRWLGTWTPSSQVITMPDASASRLPAGSKLTVEIGYRGNPDGEGSGAADLGLYFADGAPSQSPSVIDLTAAQASVPAGKTGARIRAESTIKSATALRAMWPRLGSGARSVEISVIRPDTTVEPLLWINNYRPEWPAPYILKEPVSLPAGTRLVLTAYYDNAGETAMTVKPAVALTVMPPAPQSGAKTTQP